MIAEAVEEAQQSGKDAAPVPVVSGRVARDLFHGTSALGAAVLIERGFGFTANLLAARLGGASVFGSYSLAITTANNISTYAAGGIASTAVRFSGRYGRNNSNYPNLAKALAIVSGMSATLGALVLWIGARPIAHLLGKDSLTSLLHWTALSVAGIILLECCRGFLVGQRRAKAILLLSCLVGVGMLAFVPFLSRFGPVAMICSQGAVTTGAVFLCVALFRPLGLAPVRTHVDPANAPFAGPVSVPAEVATEEPGRLGSLLRQIWSFGLVQLAGLVGLNAAGWWLTTLLARADTSMAQIGFFAIASQLRNIVSLAPSLLTESSFAVMARGDAAAEKTPDGVMAICTFATILASFVLAGVGIAITPWALPLLYGHAYKAASAATVIALATAVVHMGSGPAAARMSIVSIRTTGIINTIWAIVVAAAGVLFFFSPGNAWKAALIYFGAHVLSAVLLLIGLSKRDCIPPGMIPAAVTGGLGTLVLLGLAALRELHPQATGILTLALFLSVAAVALLLFAIARRFGWLPSLSVVRSLLERRGLWPAKALSAPNTGGFDA